MVESDVRIEIYDNRIEIVSLGTSNKNYEVKPGFIILKNSITVILPNVLVGAKSTERLNGLSKDEEKVVSHIMKNNKINRIETEKLLNLRKTHAVEFLNELIGKGIIVRVGRGKNTSYVLRGRR